MRIFEGKRVWRKVLYSKAAAVILLFVLFWLGSSSIRAYQKYDMAKDAKINAEKKFEDMEARKNLLEAKVINLSTDEGKIKELRSTFPYVLPGEEVLIVLDSEESTLENQ